MEFKIYETETETETACSEKNFGIKGYLTERRGISNRHIYFKLLCYVNCITVPHFIPTYFLETKESIAIEKAYSKY